MTVFRMICAAGKDAVATVKEAKGNIKKAYHNASLIVHPDKAQQSGSTEYRAAFEEAFKILGSAHELLTKVAAGEQIPGGTTQQQQQQGPAAGPGPGFAGFNPNGPGFSAGGPFQGGPFPGGFQPGGGPFPGGAFPNGFGFGPGGFPGAGFAGFNPNGAGFNAGGCGFTPGYQPPPQPQKPKAYQKPRGRKK